MNTPGAPLRFLTLVVVAWAGGRAWMVSGERIENPTATARAPHVATHKQGASAIARLISWLPSLSPFRSEPHHLVIDLPFERGDGRQSSASSPVTLRPVRLAAKKPELLMPEKPSPPARFDLDQAVRAASRWSGSAWVFVRDRGTGGSLATLGQLGGSQAGARLRWQLNPGDQIRSALYGRVSTPLDDLSGAEAAFGAEWHPLPGQPFWVAAERRVALGKQGRDAWAAYVAGGIWKAGLPGGTTLDGYAQAGVVGAKSRDLFADGSLRLSRPIGGEQSPRVGAGVWGAAQPGVARLDVGPHARIPIKVAKQPFSISADYRVRVAGDAAPGSGVAVTMASDF